MPETAGLFSFSHLSSCACLTFSESPEERHEWSPVVPDQERGLQSPQPLHHLRVLLVLPSVKLDGVLNTFLADGDLSQQCHQSIEWRHIKHGRLLTVEPQYLCREWPLLFLFSRSDIDSSKSPIERHHSHEVSEFHSHLFDVRLLSHRLVEHHHLDLPALHVAENERPPLAHSLASGAGTYPDFS